MTEAGTALRLEAEVLANAAEGGTSWRLRLAVPGWPGSEPGQFAMLSPGARGAAERYDPLLPRPMAVYRSGAGADATDEECADEDWIEILYKVTGRGTRLLADARPGERVRLVGPLGVPFHLPETGRRAWLVGGGTGIASLYELAVRARAQAPVAVLLGARTAEDLMGRRDFAELGVELQIATEDGSAGHRGLVTELLADVLAAGEPATVYACGPTPMMERAAELARQANQPCAVSLENRMACGFGVCLGCAVPRLDGGFALVCRDGPVFASGAVGWAGLP